MMQTTISLKRERIDEYFTVAKKARLHYNPSIFALPKELKSHIFPCLSDLDLLRLESTSKSSADLTRYEWKERKIREKMDFKWKMTQGTLDSDKWDYCVGRALRLFCSTKIYHNATLPNIDLATEIHTKFKGLTERFPILEEYFGHYIYKFSKIKVLVGNKEQLKFRNAVFDKNYAGEMLLKGLIASAQRNDLLMKQCFLEAIKRGATVASRLIQDIPSFYYLHWDLAIEAAKHEDEEAIRILARETGGIEKMTDLAYEKYRSRQWADCDVLSSFLIAREKAPAAPLLTIAAYTKAELKQSESSESLFIRALEIIPNPNAKFMAQLAKIKMKLKKISEAEAIYDRIIPTYELELEPCGHLFSNAGLVKLKLEKPEESIALYKKALEIYGRKPPAVVLSNLALAYLKQNNLIEADRFYSRALIAYKGTPPERVVTNARFVKSQL